jgi:hypothetical protein
MQQKRPDIIRISKACSLVFAACLLLIQGVCAGATVPDVQHYDCVGEVNSENIFLPESATLTTQRFALTLSLAGNYLKRDPTLAAGCLMPQIEICQCELTPERITCRSLGLNPRNGQEVSADFTLVTHSGQLQFQARRLSPASGELVETQGQLLCTLAKPAHLPGAATP